MATRKIREIRSIECDADTRKILETRPFCDCTFQLANSADAGEQVAELAYTVAQGLDYFRQKLVAEQSSLYLALGEIGKRHQAAEILAKVSELVPSLENTQDFPSLTVSQLHILKNATRDLDTSGPLHSERRRSNVEVFIGLNPEDIREIEDELDSLAGLNI